MTENSLVESAEVTLVPIDDNGAVAVFAPSGKHALDVIAQLRQSPSMDLSELVVGHTVQTLGLAGSTVTGASAALPALASLQGLVQLAPETLALLNSGHHLMQAAGTGQQLGTVVNASGTVVANARFVPLSMGVSVTTVAASLGPAVALAAIQFQLNRLENLLGQVKLFSLTLLAESRTNRWAEVEARIDRINREVAWAIELGTVPGHMVENITDDAVTLHAFALSTTELLATRVQDLSGRIRAKDKRELLESAAHAIVRDAIDLSLAANSWLAVETLRSFHIQQDADPVAQRYGEHVFEHAMSTSETWRAEADSTLTSVQRLLSRIAAQEHHVLKRNDRRTASLARRVSGALAQALPDVEPVRLASPAGTPGLDTETAELVLQEARWVLDADTEVLALIGVSVNRAPGFQIETPDHMLIGLVDDFLSSGTYIVLAPTPEVDEALSQLGVEVTFEKPDAQIMRTGRRAAAEMSSLADRALGLTKRSSRPPAAKPNSQVETAHLSASAEGVDD